MKKVLIYRSRLLPVSETFILDHAENLSDWDVCLAGYKLVSGLDLSGLSVITEVSVNSSRISYINFLTNPLKSKLYENIKKLNPDLIHAHFAIDAVEVLPIAKKLNIPLVVTLHGYDINSTDKAHLYSLHPGRLCYLLRRSQLLDYASAFFAVSGYLGEMAAKRGYPREKLLTHYLGINLSKFAATENFNRAGVLFVGRLVEKKGCQYLLRAVGALKAKNLHPRVTVIGSGPERDFLGKLAVELGLDVEFMGSQAHEVVVRELQKARVFCMPSTQASSGDNEGLGLVYLEAQIAGTPVVAFDQGPVSDAVISGVTGLLVEDKNVEQLAASIAKMLTDDDLWQSFSLAGTQFVRDRFDISVRSRELIKFYESLIQGRAA